MSTTRRKAAKRHPAPEATQALGLSHETWGILKPDGTLATDLKGPRLYDLKASAKAKATEYNSGRNDRPDACKVVAVQVCW